VLTSVTNAHGFVSDRCAFRELTKAVGGESPVGPPRIRVVRPPPAVVELIDVPEAVAIDAGQSPAQSVEQTLRDRD